MLYKCPKCECMDIDVEASIVMHLSQDVYKGSVELLVSNGAMADFNGESIMVCNNPECEHTAPAQGFWV